MATTTLPQPRVGADAHRGRWIAGIIAVVLIALLAALVISRANSGAATTAATTTVASGTIIASVAGSGSVAAAQSLDLAFQTSGSVTQVLVAAGDTVASGQPLAQLDTRALALKVASAQANLDSARLKLTQIQEGNATPEDLAGQQASLASAEAQLEKTRTGDVTAADIASASAQLRSAQAKLDDLKAGPKPAALASAQASYDQAQTTLTAQRASLATAKEKALSAVTQAADTLRTKQDAYSTIYWANRERENQPGGLSQSAKDSEAAALREVASAEASLRQAQLAYEQAKQDEITGLATAESRLRDADQQLRTAREGATALEITQAQASVDQAQASLTKLRQGGTAAAVAIAQASVDQARAKLTALTAPATATDIQIQQASIAVAEQSLKQAQLDLDHATLTAPFAGVVSAVNIVPGSPASSGSSAISLLDRSILHVDLTLSENDVAKVALGQQVALTIDALKTWGAAGTVSYIAPAATTTNGVVTYAVRVSFPDSEAQVRVGMTANLVITTDEHADVLVVPASALLPKGAGYSVQLRSADGKTTSEVDVQAGLSDGVNTEIISGLQAGDTVVTNPSTTTTTRGGMFGGG
ncbi:MAG: efflux RND transporter periplasmic adaptor subunit [Oscillochloris sp.]|nr:efflux RND transporter periplasmic adaptor subunit [Oscillochloris sp.]